MGAKARPKKHAEGGNIFWVTMSDLFIGMFMIFATLFFAFCANTGQGQSAEVTQAAKQSTEKMIEELKKQDIEAILKVEATDMEEEPEEGKKVDVEIDPFSGMAKISDMELFKLNSAEITPAGKQFLTKFLPAYFDAILNSSMKNYIKYVVIQGHTDSQLFRGVNSIHEQYMKNMNLSMNRAYNVAYFAFQICKGKPYYKELTHIIRVEGASFSKPIKVKGVEDYTRSRRVELRLVLKEQKMDVLQQFFRQGTGAYEKLK